MTCYYYRGAYYKAFWADPPSCAVGEPRSSYLGENSFPLIIQNVHRYFLIFALLLIVFLTLDVWNALWFEDAATGVVSFGIGVGTLVLALNVVLIGSYTLGCHSLRHLVGGRHDRLCRPGCAASLLRLCQRSQSPSHALRLAESGVGRLRGRVRAVVRDGYLDRLQAVVRRFSKEAGGLRRWDGSAVLFTLGRLS